MKHKWLIFYQYAPWLMLLLCVDGFAALLLWLANLQAFLALSAVILLTTVLLFIVLVFILNLQEQKRFQAFETFLTTPDIYHEEALIKAISPAQADAIRLLGTVLREQQLIYSQVKTELCDYEEYVEAWAHETKTPLSLLTMILDNRADEISAPVHFKLDYIRNQMQEGIYQMLYYARLKSPHKDYLFEHINIRLCIEDVLADYAPLFGEKKFQIDNQVPDTEVFTDRRGIQFLFGQIISNAIKYSTETPKLTLTLEQSQTVDILCIRDNGIGVRRCDLPYIFEKGFTGDSVDNRKKATGMGLYFSKKMADELNLRLDVQSEWGKGFALSIYFPKVEKHRL